MDRPRMRVRIADLLAALPPEARKVVEEHMAWRAHTGRATADHPPRLTDPRKRRKLMQRVGGAQNWRCCHCGVRTNEAALGSEQAASFDHVIPLALGGTNHPDNLVLACRGCNSARGIDIAWTPKKDTTR